MKNTDQKIIQPKPYHKMKTSNKFLVLVTLVVVAYLVVYDAGLKAEYLKGDFKSRFFGMEQLSIKDFSSIDHQAANMIDVTIEKGDKFSVWLRKDVKDKVQITKQGNTLMIKYTGPDERRYYYSGAMIITCPHLDSITTTANVKKEQTFQNDSYGGDIDVVGFDQQKMIANAGPLTQIELKNNKLEYLQATIGDNSPMIGSLNVNASNHIKLANIKVNGISELKMSNPDITTLEHSFSDNASLVLTGKAIRLLK